MIFFRSLAKTLITSIVLIACCPTGAPTNNFAGPDTVTSFTERPFWVAENTFRITWEEPETNGGTVNNYAVYALRCDGTYAEQRAVTNSNATTIDFGPDTEDTGSVLSPGHSYMFAVRARTSAGGWDTGGWNVNVKSSCTELGPLGEPVDGTPAGELPEIFPPSAVTIFLGTPERISSDTINLTWEEPKESAGEIVDYFVYAYLCDGTPLGLKARLWSNNTSIDFGPVTESSGTGLTEGASYAFAVQAKNQAGWSDGLEEKRVLSPCSNS
jgi:hypothetical protein